MGPKTKYDFNFDGKFEVSVGSSSSFYASNSLSCSIRQINFIGFNKIGICNGKFSTLNFACLNKIGICYRKSFLSRIKTTLIGDKNDSLSWVI